jgi:hypothetical protein
MAFYFNGRSESPQRRESLILRDRGNYRVKWTQGYSSRGGEWIPRRMTTVLLVMTHSQCRGFPPARPIPPDRLPLTHR